MNIYIPRKLREDRIRMNSEYRRDRAEFCNSVFEDFSVDDRGRSCVTCTALGVNCLGGSHPRQGKPFYFSNYRSISYCIESVICAKVRCILYSTLNDFKLRRRSRGRKY